MIEDVESADTGMQAISLNKASAYNELNFTVRFSRPPWRKILLTEYLFFEQRYTLPGGTSPRLGTRSSMSTVKLYCLACWRSASNKRKSYVPLLDATLSGGIEARESRGPCAPGKPLLSFYCDGRLNFLTTDTSKEPVPTRPPGPFFSMLNNQTRSRMAGSGTPFVVQPSSCLDLAKTATAAVDIIASSRHQR